MPNENAVFVNIDFSPNKDSIDKSLEADDFENAQSQSQKILQTQKEIINTTKAIGGKLVFDSIVNLIVYIPYDKELIESFSDSYEQHIGDITNIGVGRSLVESHSSLDVVESKSKGNIIIYSGEIKEDLAKNREFYKQSRKESYDLKIAGIIKSAFLELNIITTDKKVYDVFMRLVKQNNLNTIEELQSFFYKPLEELKEDIRGVYQSQKTGGLAYALQPQTAPGQNEVNKSRRQKSPYRRHNWWSREDYNENVDWRKTDNQYGVGNATKDSQEFSMGSEPGDPIATY